MSGGTRLLALGGFALVIALSAVVFSRGRIERQSQGTASAVFVVPDVSRDVVDGAFARSESYSKNPSGVVRAGILPHHTLVAPMLAAFFRGFGTQTPPATIVIVGPDHGNLGRDYVTTTRKSWKTPDGVVDADVGFVDALVANGQASIDDRLIEREHGVSAILPYLKRVFPRVRIVQLAVRGDLRTDRLDKLSESLRGLLGPNDLLVASVDFSHYKDVTGAWSDDAVSLPVIRSGDLEAALSIPVDSPPSISLVLRYARSRHLQYQELVHTNSGEFLGDLSLPSTTSYLTAYFHE